MIRVLVAHRGTLLGGALAALISQGDDIEVTGQVHHADDIVTVARECWPDLITLDSHLAGVAEASEILATLRPELPQCRILFIQDQAHTSALKADLHRVAVSAESMGFVSADGPPDNLVTSIRALALGEPVLDPAIALATFYSHPGVLTERERAVLRLAARGAPITEIANTLFLSQGTVRNYLSRIMTKLGVRNRLEAIHAAQQSGLI